MMIKRQDITEAMRLNEELKRFEHGIKRLTDMLMTPYPVMVTLQIVYPIGPVDYPVEIKTLLEYLESEAKRISQKLSKIGVWVSDEYAVV